MVKNVVIAAEKGGIGKTTISEELAFSFERTSTPYEFRDLDGQGGTRHRGHVDDGAVVRIVDTPATLPVDTRPDVAEVIRAADLVVVPMRATPYDLQPFLRTVEVLHGLKPAVPLLVVVNCVNRYKVATQIVGWAKDEIGEENVVTLPQAEAFPQSQGVGCSVVDLGKTTPAAMAVKSMCNAIRRRVGLDVEKFAVKELMPNGR